MDRLITGDDSRPTPTLLPKDFFVYGYRQGYTYWKE